MGPDHPPSTPPSDPFYWPRPANNDDLAFLGSQFDERFLDPSQPSQGTSMFPEMVQENCLPDPSNQSSMHHAFLCSVPSGNGATATSMPHSETFHEPLNLGTRPQQSQCGNTLGTSEYPYIGQPQTIHPLPATSVSLNNWQQTSASLPRSSLGPHPRSQERTELALSDSFLGASTSSGLPRVAATASLRQELVDESAIQVTNIPPNAARGIELVSPRPADGEATVQVRRDIRITLNFDMKILSSGSATYDGLKIPKTPSVNKEEYCESGKKLLHLQIRVLGATTKVLYNTLCHKCKDRDGDKDAFPDFRAKSNIIVPQKNGRLLVAFILACCSKHREPQDSEYCLEVVLNGDSEQNTPYFQYLLPYSFSVVSKRTRNQEDLDAVDAVVLPPRKLPKTGSGSFRRVGNPESQGAGPSGVDEISSGDSRDQTNNVSPGTSGPPATSVASHRPVSSAESPMPSCRNNLAVSAAGRQENEDGLDPVIEKVIPHRGPATGGLEIGIWGSNFPTDHMPLYAGFGDNFTRAVLQMHNVLLCTLPQASAPGKVPVTLRRSPNRDAPVIGTSLCQFEYITDLNEILPIIIRIQEDCTPEVAAALDVLRKEMKNRNLTRNGKRPMRRGEASHDEIETAIIQALAPLQDTPHFEEVISKTNDYQQTLAHFAVFFGYTNLLRRLMGWNIDLSIADVNGFTALHSAYKTGDRACVDLLLEKGASETVLDALGRAPSHLMPEGFALSDHNVDTASDDQPELEQKRDTPSLFQSTDSGHGVSDEGDEKSMNKAVSVDPMHQSQSSSAASNSHSILRSPPLPVVPVQSTLSPTPLTRHHTMAPPNSRLIPLPSPLVLHARSLQRGQESPKTSVARSSSTDIPPGATLSVSADKPSAPLIPMIPYNPQSPRSVNHHQDELTVVNRYAPPPPPPPLPHPPHPPDFQRASSPPPRNSPPSRTPLSPSTPLASPRPLQLPELITKLSANLQSASSTADPSPEIQESSVEKTEKDVIDSLTTQRSLESFACGGLNGGAQAIFVPGAQNREHTAAPQQLGVRACYGPMSYDEIAAVPALQAPLLPTAALVEINPGDGTIILPAWLSLVQPQPEDRVIKVERDGQVVLDIKFKELPTLPGQRPVTRKGLVIPSTANVRTDDYYTEEDVVHLSMRVFGADTESEYNSVCNNCSKQEGKKKGKPSLVDFHAASNIINASDDGLVQVKFKFSCYPNHHSPNEGAYLLEVVLLEKQHQSLIVPSQMVVANCRLPWHFKVGKWQDGQGAPVELEPVELEPDEPEPDELGYFFKGRVSIESIDETSPGSSGYSYEEDYAASFVPSPNTQVLAIHGLEAKGVAEPLQRKRGQAMADLDDEDSRESTGGRRVRPRLEQWSNAPSTRADRPLSPANQVHSWPITTTTATEATQETTLAPSSYGSANAPAASVTPSVSQLAPSLHTAQGHQSSARPVEPITTVLDAINPRCGPVYGGVEIWLGVSNLPTAFTLYARFGTHIAKTTVLNGTTLSCVLPSASHPGRVRVTLSRFAYSGAPEYGTSLVLFEYLSDYASFIQIPLRMEENGRPEYAPTIRASVTMLQGDQAPIGAANSHAEQIESFVLDALMSLREKTNFDDIVSTTNDSNQTLAHLSALFDYMSLLEHLVGWRIDLTIADISGLTALQYACQKEDWVGIRTLLRGGAPSTLEDNLGRVPRDLLPEGSYLADWLDREIRTGEGSRLIEHPMGHEIALGKHFATLGPEKEDENDSV